MKKAWKLASLIILLVAMTWATGLVAEEGAGTSSWTGEVVDVACYVAKGAAGDGHAGCAKACVKNGQPMGLLTDDGTLVLLAADHSNGEAFEQAKELAGTQAEIQGSLAERDGMKVVTVTGAKAAG
jgi:hypothetical protein